MLTDKLIDYTSN